MCGIFAGQDPASYDCVTRSVRLNGHATSIRLEATFWEILDEIAGAQGLTTPRFLSTLHDEVLELRGEVSTQDGETIVHTFTEQPYVQITPTQVQDVGNRPFAFRDMFPLTAGEFQFRVVLKNAARSEYTIFDNSP